LNYGIAALLRVKAFNMRIGALFAVLVLLLCAIFAHADKPVLIKDSEAIQYVGKEA
jgi:hypothetical protein